jgi:hypothetical protein
MPSADRRATPRAVGAFTCASVTTIRSAHPPAADGTLSSLPMTSARVPVGLDDLDLEAVTGADLVGRADRHKPQQAPHERSAKR